MICPVCKQDMIVVEYRSIELDHCTACKGVWFDSGELELLLKSHDIKDIKPFLDNITNAPEPDTTEKRRKCPICGQKMKKIAIGEEPKILIDMCNGEHGLWFDGGEVAQVIRHLAGGHRPADDSEGKIVGFLEEVFAAPEESKDSKK